MSTTETDDIHEEIENEIDRELKEELDKLEEIFHPARVSLNESYSGLREQKTESPSPITIARLGSPNQIQTHLATPMSRTSNSTTTPKSNILLSVYEMAAVEGEKEQLQDRVRLLLTELEESERRISALNRNCNELRRNNQTLLQENNLLKARLKDSSVQHQLELLKTNKASVEGFSEVEFKLAETRAKLARSQQAFEDVQLSKEELAKELELQKLKINHVERERDAYSAAYEASLKHLEKWASGRKNSVSKSLASSFSSINPLRKYDAANVKS